MVGDLLRQHTELEVGADTPHGVWVKCPYHADGKPSMHIHEEKGMAKCFSCKEFRPLFNFLLEWGVPLDSAVGYAFSFSPSESRDPRELKEYVLGRKIPKSFLDRGFEVETLKHFRVGYDEEEGHTTVPMLYDDKLYGIKYRMYPKDFWYSEGFAKESFIYNFEPTPERIYVEGESDTWRGWQNGTKNISALLGCELTERQAELVCQHKTVFLALDNDLAGFQGAFRFYDMLRHDVNIMVIPYRADDAGACPEEEWKRAVANPKTFLEFELAFAKVNPEIYNNIIEKQRIDSLREIQRARQFSK